MKLVETIAMLIVGVTLALLCAMGEAMILLLIELFQVNKLIAIYSTLFITMLFSVSIVIVKNIPTRRIK
jgi:hypothetical protein